RVARRSAVSLAVSVGSPGSSLGSLVTGALLSGARALLCRAKCVNVATDWCWPLIKSSTKDGAETKREEHMRCKRRPQSCSGALALYRQDSGGRCSRSRRGTDFPWLSESKKPVKSIQPMELNSAHRPGSAVDPAARP